MGLHSQINDVSSDSIPLLLVALLANCYSCLRSLLLSFFHFAGLSAPPARRSSVPHDDAVLGSMGSGLAGLIVLADQLNRNQRFSYKYSSASTCRGAAGEGGGGGGGGVDCMVCLCTLRDGEQVRKLDCRHVFHKECFDGWLDHLNFNCPLCRFALVTDQRVDDTRNRIGRDLLDWFSLRGGFNAPSA